MGDISIKQIRYKGDQEIIDITTTNKQFTVVKGHYDLNGKFRRNDLIDIRKKQDIKAKTVEEYMRSLVENKGYEIIVVDNPVNIYKGNIKQPHYIKRLVHSNYVELINLIKSSLDELEFPYVCDVVAHYITEWFRDRGYKAATRYGYGQKGETYHAFTVVDYSNTYVIVDFTRVQFMDDRDWSSYWLGIKLFQESLPEMVLIPSDGEDYLMYFNNKEKCGGIKLRTAKAYSTQLKEYIERMLEKHRGFGENMTPRKFKEYSKIRAEVTKYIGGAPRPLTLEKYEKAISFVNGYISK